MRGSDTTDVAVVLVSGVRSVAVVDAVFVDVEWAAFAFRDEDGATIDEGILDILARRSLRVSHDMDVPMNIFDSLLGGTCRASMSALGSNLPSSRDGKTVFRSGILFSKPSQVASMIAMRNEKVLLFCKARMVWRRRMEAY